MKSYLHHFSISNSAAQISLIGAGGPSVVGSTFTEEASWLGKADTRSTGRPSAVVELHLAVGS